jgi:hypothetical protein
LSIEGICVSDPFAGGLLAPSQATLRVPFASALIAASALSALA